MARSFADVIAQRTDAVVERRDDAVDLIVEQQLDDRQVINPATGELLDVATVAHEQLVAALAVLRERETMLKEWRVIAEQELIRRHGDRDHPQVVGDWEVMVDRGWSRVWDADQLEDAVTALVHKGVLKAGQVTGLIRPERRVDGRLAVALLNRVGGEDKKHLQKAFTWTERKPKIVVTAVPDLADALPKGEQ